MLKYGAAGDGKTLDSAAFQRAIDEAAAYAGKAQVLVRGGHKYLVGTIELKGSIDFHLADDAELLISTHREDYRGGLPGSQNGDTMSAALGAVITATGAQGLTISGTGDIQGRAKEFMTRYDDAGGIWMPGPFRPKMFVLTGCKDLQVRDITFAEAPNWGLHMLGCDGVLVDNVKVRNLLDVPNCDGIDPDHSRNVEIRNCNIVCRRRRRGHQVQPPAHRLRPRRQHPRPRLRHRDPGRRPQDRHRDHLRHPRHPLRALPHQDRIARPLHPTPRRGQHPQHRLPRHRLHLALLLATPGGDAARPSPSPPSRARPPKPGSLHHVNVQNVTGTAENSVRVCGSAASRVHDVTLDRVAVTLARTTHFPGALFDNRPTTAIPAIQPHDTPGFSIEHADNVTLRNCSVAWGANPPDAFSYAVEAIDTTGLKIEGLKGEAAHASLGKAVSIS